MLIIRQKDFTSEFYRNPSKIAKLNKKKKSNENIARYEIYHPQIGGMDPSQDYDEVEDAINEEFNMKKK